MKMIAYMGVSLDGYIADKAGGVDWLNELPIPEGDDLGFSTFMAGIDALLMGSNSFRTILQIGDWYYDKPVYVASNSIQLIPEGYQERIKLIQGDIHELLAQLEGDGHQNIYVDGGKIVQACIQADLLDELIITHIPVLLGDGISLFGKLERSKTLEHRQTEVLGYGLVKSHYLIRNNR
ncbi:MAG: dihydrofolate reductase family protein [Candidatus Marinimicrobia bacterium]|nr:dihydrofolate reductase family protein [Candidatus Neomarinimicrobiota bacterium]MCF7850278.1 dihydrofolate reductase family protein [Candidatus Neomarinimicrobiota bacterium]MCF7903825.1 dihydrofolate reductase family protein [Candidatus Neomarinimicrobiota bacterium]